MESSVALKVVGAGLPRTGTTSLKAALEQLLGGPCYHMLEMHQRVDEDAPLWWQALEGDLTKLDEVVAGWRSAVDWPASLFWRELAERHPDSLVVLSHRGDAESWWNSVDRTVWAAMRLPNENPRNEMFNQKMRTKAGLGNDWDVEAVAKDLYTRQFDEVVDTVSPDRLLIWQPSDGWGPLCDALGVPVPEDDFFHRNDAAEFRAHMSLGDAG
jgi:hypothetical protein